MNRAYLDIGGTFIRSEVVLSDGSFFKEVFSSKEDFVAYLEALIKRYNIKEIAISFAGQVKEGVILSSPNVKVEENFDIRGYFQKKFKVELKIDNDINCALLAHSKESKINNLALLYVGTGLGAAFMSDGKIVRGEDNLSFELGHMPFKKAPFLCGCGKDNCVELFSGGAGMQKWLHLKGLSSMSLDELQKGQNQQAKEIYDNFLEGLLVATATLVTLCNPACLILGGGVIKSNKYLLDIIKKEIARYALPKSCEHLSISLDELEDASLKGAKLL